MVSYCVDGNAPLFISFPFFCFCCCFFVLFLFSSLIWQPYNYLWPALYFTNVLYIQFVVYFSLTFTISSPSQIMAVKKMERVMGEYHSQNNELYSLRENAIMKLLQTIDAKKKKELWRNSCKGVNREQILNWTSSKLSTDRTPGTTVCCGMSTPWNSMQP